MKYDIIVIGTGQAGVPLATRLAAAGKRVLIAERRAAGGTCVNTGCTPTKTMIASARAAHVARTGARLGVHAREVTVDFAAIVERKDAMVKRWRAGVERRLGSHGTNLQLVRGHARFVGERAIEIAGDVHEGDQVIINVGARAAIPRVAGLESVAWLDSARLLALRELPRHLVVMGGGYIGCELGQMMRRFGAEVTIVAPSEHLLPREDADVSAAVERTLRAEGVVLTLGKRASGVQQRGEEIAVMLADGHQGGGGGEVRGSHLLIATGRRPNTDDLGCAAGGVVIDDGGYVQVDGRHHTSAPQTYAVGDCLAGPQFTHLAWDDHRVLFEVLMGRASRPRSERMVPFTVFTDPQVAGVGLSEQQAKTQGIAVDVATMPFGSIARAIETDETEGLVKILVDPTSEAILGARIVGADAGELIHVFVVLMQAKASARAIVDCEFVHPTFAEGLQTALMKLPRYALS